MSLPHRKGVDAASSGYRFLPSGTAGAATQTVERCIERMNPLYEQGADAVRIGKYVRRWWQWVRSGVGECCDAAKRATRNGWLNCCSGWFGGMPYTARRFRQAYASRLTAPTPRRTIVDGSGTVGNSPITNG